MIPPDDFQTLVDGGFFGVQNILAGDGKAIARRIIAPIDERMQRVNFAIEAAIGDFRVAAEQRSTTFMRIRFCAVTADFSGELRRNFKLCRAGHKNLALVPETLAEIFGGGIGEDGDEHSVLFAGNGLRHHQ